MFSSSKKAAVLTVSLAGVLWLGSPAWAHDDWEHPRFHDQLNAEHGEFHGELGDLHREFHEQPHSAWQHRQFHRDLGRLHGDFDRNLAEGHHVYHDQAWGQQSPYYRQPYDEDDSYTGRWYPGEESRRSYNPYPWQQVYRGWGW